MNEETARKLLGDAIQPDGSLKETEPSWIDWPKHGTVQIDGFLTAEYLEAVAWWMRNGADPLVYLKKGTIRGRSRGTPLPP
ncbi:MAG: hypothetical protein PSV13_03955 [Lacunisphaera sp.]|nr:hypothetical protein [Lacunisphaera sp.]